MREKKRKGDSLAPPPYAENSLEEMGIWERRYCEAHIYDIDPQVWVYE